MRRRLAVAVWTLAALVACAPGEPPRTAEARPPAVAPSAPPSAAPPLPAESEERPEAGLGAPLVALVDPPLLGALEAQGFTLGELVAGSKARTTAELAQLGGFASVFDVLRKDVRAAARPHPLAKVTSIDGFRLFDGRWFDSREMEFELSGVFNRLDRRVFNEQSCGEVRFVYRLRYRTEQGGAPMSSRLPMTLNAVFLVDTAGDASCRELARSWHEPPGLLADQRLGWLTSDGPLGSKARRRWSLKSLEANLQTLRLQSSVQTTLAGHIEYALRVFRPVNGQSDAFAPAPMENMPDVAALSRDAKLRAELLEYLRQPENLRKLDLGTLDLPDRFLAEQAISFSPRGLSRAANRPFSKLFRPQNFADLDLGGMRTIRSPIALLRRLDGTSCVGCHQSRSIAGFHHVGNDPADAPRFNALASGLSTHLESDLERRRVYLSAVAAGSEPDEYRPIPERQGTGNGHGAPCGLGDPGLAEWTCAEGFVCRPLEDPEVGACFAEGAIGSPCEYGVMLSRGKPHRDYVSRMTSHACAAPQSCDGNFSGFPLGSCGASCSARTESGACGDFLDVDGFQNCLRARISHDECAKKHVFKTGLRACDAANPCRQDYVCVRTEQPGVGACVPPYFVYQLRLDGYPLER